ncbi:hypothetical protein ACQKJC_22420 [Priestia koreensis]|uniref:hypothetical protein n=1 Tax=Priestia koreensis TaxID=284581 RepID=UPI003D0154E8
MLQSLKEQFKLINAILDDYGYFLKEKEIETETVIKYIVKSVKANSEEFVNQAEIICSLLTNYVQVEIRMPNEEKAIFRFKEHDDIDDLNLLAHYLDNNLKQKLLA